MFKPQFNRDLLNEERQKELKELKTYLINHPDLLSIPDNNDHNNFLIFLSKILNTIPLFRLLKLSQTIHPTKILGNGVENYQVLFPAEKIEFGVNDIDREFLQKCLYYNNDYFERSPIFICEIIPAYIHIGLGTICTKDFQVIVDSGMQYRLTIARWRLNYLNRLKLLFAKQLSVKSAYIVSLSADNFWHFLFDCLPRIYSLILAKYTDKLTILIPDSLRSSFRELLKYLLPENFEIMYIENGTWVRVEHLVMPSYVSRCENGFLPPEYYEYIKNCVFDKLNLTPVEKLTERIYISRRNAKHRRVLNEEKLIQYLEKYNFKTVFLEDMSFPEQVELFTKVEMIVAPHGAGLGITLFSGKIKILVLYPETSPTPFFFTQFKGLGQKHYFITHDQFDENADFEVDMEEFQEIFDKMIYEAV
ncbi:Capsular polysaccharide biosynthesis protein-like [Trichodesmium erythraeum IMS101]|uniref:Capsular polysaccharide biosynthesis protein-like n=1 Tax=Trichodesmium erythraeum (strain IMS101) TaxID=203124 RepID=Q10ZU1_TRIEI